MKSNLAFKMEPEFEAAPESKKRPDLKVVRKGTAASKCVAEGLCRLLSKPEHMKNWITSGVFTLTDMWDSPKPAANTSVFLKSAWITSGHFGLTRMWDAA